MIYDLRLKNKNLIQKSINRKSKGFTLIELLVVITIIGILTTALLTTLNPLEQIRKARDLQRKNDLLQIKKALEVYNIDHGSYPQDISFGGTTLAPYLNITPNDPLSGQQYIYKQVSSGQGYRLFAQLERCYRDNQKIPGADCATDLCNYSIVSPNEAVVRYDGGAPGCGSPSTEPTPVSTATPIPTPTSAVANTPIPTPTTVNTPTPTPVIVTNTPTPTSTTSTNYSFASGYTSTQGPVWYYYYKPYNSSPPFASSFGNVGTMMPKDWYGQPSNNYWYDCNGCWGDISPSVITGGDSNIAVIYWKAPSKGSATITVTQRKIDPVGGNGFVIGVAYANQVGSWPTSFTNTSVDASDQTQKTLIMTKQMNGNDALLYYDDSNSYTFRDGASFTIDVAFTPN